MHCKGRVKSLGSCHASPADKCQSAWSCFSSDKLVAWAWPSSVLLSSGALKAREARSIFGPAPTSAGSSRVIMRLIVRACRFYYMVEQLPWLCCGSQILHASSSHCLALVAPHNSASGSGHTCRTWDSCEVILIVQCMKQISTPA